MCYFLEVRLKYKKDLFMLLGVNMLFYRMSLITSFKSRPPTEMFARAAVWGYPELALKNGMLMETNGYGGRDGILEFFKKEYDAHEMVFDMKPGHLDVWFRPSFVYVYEKGGQRT